MASSVSAADANRDFSKLLRTVRDGATVVITNHGKPVAKIIPFTSRGSRARRRQEAPARTPARAARHEHRPVDARRALRARLMLVALDTNVLVYAEGSERQADGAGRARAGQAARARVDVAAGPSARRAVRRADEKRRPLAAKARDIVLEWGDTYPIIETSSSVQLMAMELSVTHQLACLGRGDSVGRGRRQLPAAAVRGFSGRIHLERRHRRQSVRRRSRTRCSPRSSPNPEPSNPRTLEL